MKKLIPLLSLAATALAVEAAPVSPDEALTRALVNTPQTMRAPGAGYSLLNTRKAGGHDALYLFEARSGSGFIIAPADDSLPAVLGYGTSKLCDETGNFAPAFEYWLDELGRQAEYAGSHPEALARRSERPFREPIEPLCQTRWNQSTPYNNLCPMLNGSRSVTGCVATAMAQVMKYHNWPDTGEGSNQYEWQGQILSMDYSAQEFKWNLMLNDYPSVFDGHALRIDATEGQQEAVARLMVAAGHSVEMGYSPEASGAISMRIGPALGKYFRYDKSLSYLQRDYYPLDEWEEMIYTSLQNDGPVIYDGHANIGGHSFVCDGYSSDGYFHFNWGWGGMSDGYFLLDALDPINQGIGGADSGFNYMQDIIVNIRPDRTGTSEWSTTLVCNGAFDASYTRKTNIVRISSMIYNAGPGDIAEGLIGLCFTSRTEPDTEPSFKVAAFEGLGVMYGFSSLEFELPELPDGQYDMTTVYTTSTDDDAEVLNPLFPYGKTSSYSFQITSGRVLGFLPTEDFVNLSVAEITDDTPAADERSSKCEYINLQGITTAVKEAGEPRPDLPAGIYIVKTGTSAFRIAVR